MSEIKTLTVAELASILVSYAKQDKKILDYKVFLSTDPEGNGYSTLDDKWSFQFGDDDKILTIMPFQEGLQDEDIAPIENQKLMEELHGNDK